MLTWIAVAMSGTSALLNLILFAREGHPFAGLMAMLCAGLCATNLWFSLN